MNKAVIIAAGGTGSRMNHPIPKQFRMLAMLPVLTHSIRNFFEYDNSIQIIVVLPESEIDTWNQWDKKYPTNISYEITAGGNSRFESVKNGLSLVKADVVAVHDGARPLVTKELIQRCFDGCKIQSNAIPSVKISETVRKLVDGSTEIVDRESLRIIQTPQCFNTALLKKAYTNNKASVCTDDAGVFEMDGNRIHLVEGDRRNIKITIEEDLLLCEAILSSSMVKK